MPEPPALSVTLAVKVTGCPATAVAGRAIVPVGLTMSGIVLSLSLTTSAAVGAAERADARPREVGGAPVVGRPAAVDRLQVRLAGSMLLNM